MPTTYLESGSNLICVGMWRGRVDVHFLIKCIKNAKNYILLNAGGAECNC